MQRFKSARIGSDRSRGGVESNLEGHEELQMRGVAGVVREVPLFGPGPGPEGKLSPPPSPVLSSLLPSPLPSPPPALAVWRCSALKGDVSFWAGAGDGLTARKNHGVRLVNNLPGPNRTLGGCGFHGTVTVPLAWEV